MAFGVCAPPTQVEARGRGGGGFAGCARKTSPSAGLGRRTGGRALRARRRPPRPAPETGENCPAPTKKGGKAPPKV